MKIFKQALHIFCAALFLTPVPALAESMQEALVRAYNTNPSFQAELAAVRAAHERIPEAQAGWRPSLFADADIGKVSEETEGGLAAGDQTRTPKSAALTIEQPLYRGGRTIAAVSQAEFVALAQQAVFKNAEQNLLRDAAAAYMDVTRAQAVLELTQKTENVLKRQLEAVQVRLEAGDVTRTDLAQAEARVAGATAQRRQAEGRLTAAKTTYQRIIGVLPADLSSPMLAADIPTSTAQAIETAETNNPVLAAARLAERASAAGIDLALGGLLPALSLQAGISHAEESAFRGDERDHASTILRLSVPLYQGGAQHARVRQAKELRSQRLMESRNIGRLVHESTIQSWEALQTARANIESFEAQANAAERALEGVRAEENAGARTILDVLDAEQELLNAQVNLVSARRDAFVAALDLRVAMGTLTATALNLPVNAHGLQAHYERAHGQWLGLGTEN